MPPWAADNRYMGEWMRLSLAAGTLVVALACAVTAAMTDQGRLGSSRDGQRAFRVSALLLLGCIPLLALDSAGVLGPVGTFGLVLVAAAATVLTVVGRRYVSRSPYVTSSSSLFGLGAVHIAPVSPLTEAASAGTPELRTTQLRMPVLMAAITDDGFRVELNQN